MALRAFASVPLAGSSMQVAVAPPNGAAQSVNGPPDLRAVLRHVCTHFPLEATSFASAFDVPDSHLSSSLLAGGVSAVGCRWGWSRMEIRSVLDGQLGTFRVAPMPPRDVLSSLMMPVGGLAAGRKTSMA